MLVMAPNTVPLLCEKILRELLKKQMFLIIWLLRSQWLVFGCSTLSIFPLRHDWYQTESQVTITLMVKNVKKEDVSVTFKEKEVTRS